MAFLLRFHSICCFVFWWCLLIPIVLHRIPASHPNDKTDRQKRKIIAKEAAVASQLEGKLQLFTSIFPLHRLKLAVASSMHSKKFVMLLMIIYWCLHFEKMWWCMVFFVCFEDCRLEWFLLLDVFSEMNVLLFKGDVWRFGC